MNSYHSSLSENRSGAGIHFLFALAIIIIVKVDSGRAQEHLPTGLDSLLQRSIIATVNQEYQRAFQLVDSVIAEAPEHPLGHLFRAATLQSLMLDTEDYAREEEFLASLKKCRHWSKKLLREHPNSAWGHFCLGSAYGYESYYLSKKSRYFDAFHTGIKAVNHLQAAIRSEPELYDAYLGVGTYKYYRSKLRDKLKIPFIPDETEEGIAMIRKTARKGKYANYAAANGLTWVLLDENRPEEAYAIADSMLQKFPRSRFFMWGAAESAVRLDHHERALSLYQRIMDSLRQDGLLSAYMEAVCRTKMARMKLRLGRQQDACEDLAVVKELDFEIHSGRKNIKDEVRHLHEQCSKERASSNGESGVR